jgi:cellulose synthase/poly-beta-1,6-N-acetylglucosamine synthase-like glycosyltransferase
VNAVLWQALGVFNWVVLAYFIVLNAVYLTTSLFAFGALRRYARRLKSLDLGDLVRGAGAPPITLLAPAYNEEATCVEAVRSLLTLDYPEYEILVVNDGSTDRTLERLVAEFNLKPTARIATAFLDTRLVRQIYRSRRHPNLWIVDKENGGKADALNAGINFCRTPLFCAMDADSLLEREALVRIVRPFLEDASTVATGGILRIANGCVVDHGQVLDVRLPRNLWARFQVLEYLRAFLSGRMGWDALQATLVISGAFGMFRRSTVVDAGGYATDTVGEDMELVVRLHRHCREHGIPYAIHFVPDPVAWTECPETLRQLARQRDRWQRGLFQSLNRHRVMLMNSRYGRAGLLAFPYFFFLEMLGPVVEALGYVAFAVAVLSGRAEYAYVVAFLMVAIVLGIALSVAAVALEELSFRRYPRLKDLLSLFLLALGENFGYRQLTAWWRVKGTWSALRGVEGWGRMARKGFTLVEGTDDER